MRASQGCEQSRGGARPGLAGGAGCRADPLDTGGPAQPQPLLATVTVGSQLGRVLWDAFFFSPFFKKGYIEVSFK